MVSELEKIKEIEEKLLKCQSYKSGTIPKWKSQTNLTWPTAIRLLKELEVFDASRLREIIHNIVINNKHI